MGCAWCMCSSGATHMGPPAIMKTAGAAALVAAAAAAAVVAAEVALGWASILVFQAGMKHTLAPACGRPCHTQHLKLPGRLPQIREQPPLLLPQRRACMLAPVGPYTGLGVKVGLTANMLEASRMPSKAAAPP
jgi:hypothetical protein